MIIAVTDILTLAPNFAQAVSNVHLALAGFALVIILAGFVGKIQDAFQERHVDTILPAMIRITLISLFLNNMASIGGWLGDIVEDVEQSSGVNGNPMSAFTSAIKTKFGVDVAAILGPISPGGTASLAGPQQPGTMLTSYGYSTDPTPDGASSQGIGAFAPFLQPGSLIAYQSPGQPASAALSPDMEAKYAVQPGETFQVTSSSGTTYNLIFSDRTSPDLTGRVDIYDPNNALAAGADVGQPITGIAFGGAPSQTVSAGNGLNDWWNAMLHPVQSAQAWRARAVGAAVSAALCMQVPLAAPERLQTAAADSLHDGTRR
jgi:hypothetical protein